MEEEQFWPEYPVVQCDGHPDTEVPGYIVCEHAKADKSKIAYVEQPTHEKVGIISCATCWGSTDIIRTAFRYFNVMCANCAEQLGLTTVGKYDA